MSIIVKIDTSRAVPALLQRHIGAGGGDFWQALKGKHASRWAGIHRPRWECWTFSVRLPAQVKEGFRLLRACFNRLADTPGVSGLDRRVLATIARKLRAALGWPAAPLGTSPEELGLRRHIEQEPETLVLWQAYADWLLENDHPEYGESMARWLSPRHYTQKELKEQSRKRS
jgi:hypothetical protein